MAEGNIKPIDRTSVHKICSGQVVLTLAVAVKELVENSIDAGANIIDVKLKEFGSEMIEVIDNGKGVKASDFQSLTLKHHTSKIADFSDVPFVSTFGFRGEALSSLCALSDLEITTRHAEADVGTTLKFDHNGVLIKSTPTHRQVGTTITLKNIFSTFPVRHKEFLRHLRKEYAKMLHLLTAYCLISVNKRITCSNTNEKGKKTVTLSTNSSQGVKDNIISIFGDKQVKQLMEIVQHSPSEEVLQEYFLPETASETSKAFKLEGYISNSTHGEGRSSCDRQFYFINGRPCDLPKVSKLTNEVYHSFNKNQYPFVFMNIILGEGCADVNVTPDKRQIFIPDEKVLLALIKTSLLDMYGKQPSQMMASLLTFQPIKRKAECISPSTQQSLTSSSESNDSQMKRKLEQNSKCFDSEDPFPHSFKNQKMDVSSQDQDNLHPPTSSAVLPSCSKVPSKTSPEKHSVEKSLSKSNASLNLNHSKNHKKNDSVPNINFTLTVPVNEDKLFKKLPTQKAGSSKLSQILALARRDSNSPGKVNNSMSERTSKRKLKEIDDRIINFFESLPSQNKTEMCRMEDEEKNIMENRDANEMLPDCHEENNREDSSEESVVETIYDEAMPHQRVYKTIPFSMELFKKKPQTQDELDEENEKCAYRKFRSKIDPNQNKDAEEELKKEISKDDFGQMEIIGQFNLGFIIARLRDDLFIIDQHATDEKYNFEQLQKETVLETQQLLQPQNLNLSAVAEATLLDNLRIFEMNGFNFKVNEENACGEKVQLVSVPVSHNWSFGKEDVDELIFMLTDNPIRMVRPSRVNQMFASRACRKSVMIGTALTKSMMKKLVIHMGEIEQPWNCPHGRPTIRHLFNLNLLKPI